MGDRRRTLLAALMGLFLAAPAWAWEFSVRDATCRLTHDAPQARVSVVHDLATGLYSITIKRYMATWPEAPVFAIRFDGPRGLTITTDRQTYGQGGAALTVTDTGFGNVLDGLAFNETATAIHGETEVSVPLDGAAPEVAKFRACATARTA